jgi:hypothetical protein
LETVSQAETIPLALQTLVHLVEHSAPRWPRLMIDREGSDKIEILIPHASRQ